MPVKGIKFPHEVPAQWDDPCRSMTLPIASVFGSAKRRVLQWLGAGGVVAIILALLIMWWA